MFLFVLFRILHCMIYLAKALWTNLRCLRLRQYLYLPLRLVRWISVINRGQKLSEVLSGIETVTMLIF